MSSPSPTRQSDSLADVVELVLDKGIVINADIAVSIGDTELLGIQLRAAIASFETAAKYGLEFPEGTDMERVEAVAGTEEIATDEAHAEEVDESDDAEQITIEQAHGGEASGSDVDSDRDPDEVTDDTD